MWNYFLLLSCLLIFFFRVSGDEFFLICFLFVFRWRTMCCECSVVGGGCVNHGLHCLLFEPENERSTFLWNVGKRLPEHTASNSRSLFSSGSSFSNIFYLRGVGILMQTYSESHTGKHLSHAFPVLNVLKSGSTVLTLPFNLVLEFTIKNASAWTRAIDIEWNRQTFGIWWD
jgi:hypothetical protein